VLAATITFFLVLVTFIESPFKTGPMRPDGVGLNPQLKSYWMMIHPPFLYLGYVGFTVPFAFAIAALATRRTGDLWFRTTRRWTLFSWFFLGIGILLGSYWAYIELGWGGYWAWDPVENASFMPWLAGTAYLHSVMIQEKRQMFKGWNVGLIIFTYILVILGTLNVRSGLVSSVHSFAQSNIGWFFLGFLGFMILFSLYWIVVRYDQLRSKNQIDSFLSREAAFMLNNVLFLLIAAVTLFFTYLPVMSELVTGQRMTVGASFFEKFNGPLFAALLVLMGIAPLTMWYRTSIRWLRRMTFGPLVAATLAVVILFILDVRNWLALLGFWIVTFSLILTIFEFIRPGYKRVRNKGESPFKAVSGFITQNRRRYGGYIIHLGVLVMAFGIISTELYQQETQIRLTRGNSVPLGEFSMVFNGVERYPGPDDLEITEASVDVFKDGEFVRTLNPRTELYTRTQQPMTIPGVRSTFTEDFYVIMINWEGTSADAATFRIYVNPLINWVWAGAFIFLAGTLVAAWPDPAEDKIVAAERSRRRIAISGATGD